MKICQDQGPGPEVGILGSKYPRSLDVKKFGSFLREHGLKLLVTRPTKPSISSIRCFDTNSSGNQQFEGLTDGITDEKFEVDLRQNHHHRLRELVTD